MLEPQNFPRYVKELRPIVNKDLKAYYTKRAPVYDEVYLYPERQQDLRFLEKYIANQFKNKTVLEVAAGTGYWTQFIALEAKTVMATDATPAALEQIKDRANAGSVSTLVWDAYSLDQLPGEYNGLFAGLWISHVPLQELNAFIQAATRKLSPDARIIFLDNSKAQCDRLPISHTDVFGNTYQDRPLDNGETYRVLKNFPSHVQLKDMIEGVGKNDTFIELDNYWLFQFECN